MTDQTPPVNIDRAVLGGCIALVGVILFLDWAGIVRTGGMSGLWPILFIGLGARKMFRSEQSRRDGDGRGLITIGVIFLVFQLQIVRFREFWPVLLIAGGLAMVWEALWSGRHHQSHLD